MNGADLLKGVDFLHREKNIPRDLIFSGIEKAVRLAITKKYETEDGVEVSINRDTGEISARRGDHILTPDELGRIAAQSAKQLMIQNFREAESEEVFAKYKDRKGDIVYATVQRVERGLALCNLEADRAEAILPKSEQIPGEMPHTNERLKAIILDVRRTGNRVKIVLSNPSRLFAPAFRGRNSRDRRPCGGDTGGRSRGRPPLKDRGFLDRHEGRLRGSLPGYQG